MSLLASRRSPAGDLLAVGDMMRMYRRTLLAIALIAAQAACSSLRDSEPEAPSAEARGAAVPPAEPPWPQGSGAPMIIESRRVCSDGTNVTAAVSTTQATLTVNERRRIVLPAVARNEFSDGSNRYWILPYGLSRIALAGQEPATCSPAPPRDP